MARKETTPKKRPPAPKPEKEVPTRWDKVKVINGKIVRYKMEDQENFTAMGVLIGKGKARRLYSGVDGNFTYFYYEITD